jgi:hypothetical protein
MFGKRIAGREDEPSGSRVLSEESQLSGTTDWVQQRVKIDRFTGGSFPAALFSEQPAYGGDAATVAVDLTLRKPQDHEIGLLLLVLKDLWSGDVVLGGEGGVGRGRLKGLEATLTHRSAEQVREWQLAQRADGLEISGTGSAEELEGFVSVLNDRRAP